MAKKPIYKPEYLDSDTSDYQVERRIESFDEADREGFPNLEVIRPPIWPDGGIDQYWEVKPSTRVAYLEFKHARELTDRYYWTPNDATYVSRKLQEAYSMLLSNVVNHSIKMEDVKNIIAFADSLDSPEGKKYLHVFTKTNLGRGLILYVMRPKCNKSRCIVNFTDSEYCLELQDRLVEYYQSNSYKDRDIALGDLSTSFEQVGSIIQPIISQLLSFLIEAYARQDFDTAYNYLEKGEKRGVVRLSHPSDISLVKYLQNVKGYKVKENRKVYLAKVLCKLLDVIHFDNLYDLVLELDDKGIDPLEEDIFETDILDKHDIQSDYVDFVRFIRQTDEEYDWLGFLVKLLKDENVRRGSNKVMDSPTRDVTL